MPAGARPRRGGPATARLLPRRSAPAGRAEAVLCRRIRHWQPDRLLRAPAVAAEAAIERRAAALAGEAAWCRIFAGVEYHWISRSRICVAARSLQIPS